MNTSASGQPWEPRPWASVQWLRIGHCLYPAKFTYLVGGAAVPSVIRLMFNVCLADKKSWAAAMPYCCSLYYGQRKFLQHRRDAVIAKFWQTLQSTKQWQVLAEEEENRRTLILAKIPTTAWTTLSLYKELSYCKQIGRQLRTQYIEGIYRPKYCTIPWNLG